MNEEDILTLDFVRQTCAAKPHLLPKIIEYATAGVKEFAEKQSDKTSKMGFVLTQVLDKMPAEKQFGAFSRGEILEMMEVIHGTPWHNKELQKLGKS